MFTIGDCLSPTIKQTHVASCIYTYALYDVTFRYYVEGRRDVDDITIEMRNLIAHASVRDERKLCLVVCWVQLFAPTLVLQRRRAMYELKRGKSRYFLVWFTHIMCVYAIGNVHGMFKQKIDL